MHFFCAGTTHRLTNGIAVLQIVCAKISYPFVWHTNENTVNLRQQPFFTTLILK